MFIFNVYHQILWTLISDYHGNTCMFNCIWN